MEREPAVDVAINAYLKPYETLLCLASLLRYSGGRIGSVYLAVEPVPPMRWTRATWPNWEASTPASSWSGPGCGWP